MPLRVRVDTRCSTENGLCPKAGRMIRSVVEKLMCEAIGDLCDETRIGRTNALAHVRCWLPLQAQVSSDLPGMVPLSVAAHPAAFLSSRQQTASLVCLSLGLVILATHPSGSRSALSLQAPKCHLRSSTTVELVDGSKTR